MNSASGTTFVKAYYRPIEAAIRWSGLWEREQEILSGLEDRDLPEGDEFSNLPILRLNAERILDALVHKELPAVTANLLSHRPQLTIRHVDLKTWMTQYYPEERPAFLFNSVSTAASHSDTIVRIGRQDTGTALDQQSASEAAQPRAQLSARADTTYLHIIGALLELLLSRNDSGGSPRLRTQESIIATLVDTHGHRLGIAQRTLEKKFAEARRRISSG
jgi:hypothetical protein